MIATQDIIEHVTERFLDLNGGEPLGQVEHILIGYAAQALAAGRTVGFVPHAGRVLVAIYRPSQPSSFQPGGFV